MSSLKTSATGFSKGNGTGPFVCKEFSPGVRSVGTRNPNYYHEGRPYLDQIVFLGITDNAARVDALLSGDIDMAGSIDPHSTAQVKSASGFEIFETKSADYTDLIMHLDAPDIGNPDFVMAMKLLQNRQQVLNSVLLGYGTMGNDRRAEQPVLRCVDPAAAVRARSGEVLAAGAGILNKSVDLVCRRRPRDRPIWRSSCRNSAREIGFNLQIRRVPLIQWYWSNFWLKAPFAYGNINPRPNPDILFSLFFQSSAPWNESKWKNDQFDKMLLDARWRPISPSGRQSMATCSAWCATRPVSAFPFSSAASTPMPPK